MILRFAHEEFNLKPRIFTVKFFFNVATDEYRVKEALTRVGIWKRQIANTGFLRSKKKEESSYIS